MDGGQELYCICYYIMFLGYYPTSLPFSDFFRLKNHGKISIPRNENSALKILLPKSCFVHEVFYFVLYFSNKFNVIKKDPHHGTDFFIVKINSLLSAVPINIEFVHRETWKSMRLWPH